MPITPLPLALAWARTADCLAEMGRSEDAISLLRDVCNEKANRRLTFTCLLSLADLAIDANEKESLLWASGNIVERQAYAVVAGNKSATDRNKSEAIALVSKKLAESAYNRLTDNF